MTNPPTDPAPDAAPDAQDRADFGFAEVPRGEKARLVRGVFDSVADRYDLMNDLMSGGLHRFWKAALIAELAPRPGERLIDVAGGTGDVAFRAQARAKGRLDVVVVDANAQMVAVGRNRALDRGIPGAIAWATGDAERLPLPDGCADAVTISFGLRNVTDRAAALRDMRRVLRPGGRFLCLEFSHVGQPSLAEFYDRYSFAVIPALGRLAANDAESYRYLVESIRRFPRQAELAAMMETAGFARVSWRDMTGGVVALHKGWRL